MYRYYSHLKVSPIKHFEEGKEINNEIFNNIPNLVKYHVRANCLQYGFVMYTDKVIMIKLEVIPHTYNYMIAVDFSKE